MSDRKLSSGRGAVFLDRDGTLIRQVECMHRLEQLGLLPGAAEGIRLLNEKNQLVVVVTNQPVVARGLASEAAVDAIHAELKRRLGRKGAHLDAVYFCPHHPNATLEKYRLKCGCRKPEPGMILRAAREHEIDLRQSVMIGDTTQDLEAGRRAGVRTILVRTGHGGHDPWQYDAVPDWTARNLREAAQKWLTVSSE